VYDFEVSGSTVYACGSFTSIGGQSRSHIAALDATTGLATDWDPAPDGPYVNALAVSGSTVYACGYFFSNRWAEPLPHRGAGCHHRARHRMGPQSGQLRLSLAASGSSFTRGGFSDHRRTEPHLIAALDATTGLATGWNPG
jgi:hypothetical protein